MDGEGGQACVNIGAGYALVARVIDGRIVLEKRADLLARFSGLWTGWA